jgi:hypothetical protein
VMAPRNGNGFHATSVGSAAKRKTSRLRSVAPSTTAAL